MLYGSSFPFHDPSSLHPHFATATSSQLKVHIEMEIFVWWEDLTTGREEWRFTGTEYGELSVTLSGVYLRLMLSAGNLGIPKKTVTIICKIVTHNWPANLVWPCSDKS